MIMTLSFLVMLVGAYLVLGKLGKGAQWGGYVLWIVSYALLLFSGSGAKAFLTFIIVLGPMCAIIVLMNGLLEKRSKSSTP